MIINNKQSLQKAKNIKAVIFDVDGVLTDCGVIFDDNGLEYKRYNAKDGLGIHFLKKYGFKLGVITGRKSKVVELRCEELGLEFHKHGIRNKLTEYENFKQLYDLKDENIAYVGDDIIDLAILTRCGLSASPIDARNYIKETVDIVTQSKGGEGVLRDLADYIFQAQGLFDEIIEQAKQGNI